MPVPPPDPEGGGGGGGITAAQANTALSAGGSNPLTELGYIAFKDGADTAVEIIDDPDSPGNPRLRILNPATGDAYVEAGLTASGFPGITIKNAGVTVAVLSEQRIALGDPAGVTWFHVQSDGVLTLQDGVAERTKINPGEGSLTLFDVTGETRVTLKDDGSGLTLFDSGGIAIGGHTETTFGVGVPAAAIQTHADFTAITPEQLANILAAYGLLVEV